MHLGKKSMILGYNWLQNHNPEINWQTKDVKMSHCPVQCSTCRVEDKRNVKVWKSTTSRINACRSGAFLTMVEEDKDESPHVNADKTDEEVQDTVRGHPSVSLLPLSSPTLPLFICTPFPHLCTISRDYTQSQRLPHQWPDDFHTNSPTKVNDFHPPSLLGPEWHRTSHGHIGTGLHDTTAPPAITWTPIYGRLGTRRLGTVILSIPFVV
jgi:hypothetical protein